MMRLNKRWILLPAFLLSLLTHANLVKVDDRGDASPSTGGTTTLRQAIALAAPGDTVLISVAGTIQLNSPLNINKSIRIIGPSPIHSTIDVKGNYIQVSATSDTVHLYGVKITSSLSTSSAAVRILAGSRLLLRDCVLKGISNTSAITDGGAVEVVGTLVAYNCSFINNSVQENGGAISIASGAQALLVNCTLAGNSSGLSGGAIYNGEEVRLVHCTFRNNAASSGRHIYAVSILLFTAHTEFQNCLFHQTSPAGSELQGGLLGGWISDGGNVYTFPLGSLLTVTPPSDKVSIPATALFLESTATIDGYGLEYFRITNASSVAVENGVSPGTLPVPSTDARRAPRILEAGTAAGMAPDAGAVEFTPYMVNNTGSSAATAGTLPYQLAQLQATADPSPYYVEFTFSSPVTVTGIAPAVLSKPGIFIDGFSCKGSLVPGPGASLSTVTPAITGYEMGGTGSGNLLQFSGNNIRVNGMGFTNSDNAIAMNASAGVQVQGNVFHTQSGAGLSLTTITNAMIGGEFFHQRNVFKNGVKGIDLSGGGQVKIYGNFIGTDETGLADGGTANQTGIQLSGITGPVVIGGDRSRGRGNLVSGLGGNGIGLDNTNGTRIYGNTIGLNFSMSATLPNAFNGIRIGAGSSNIKIGDINLAADSNMIVGNLLNGILVEAGANNVDITRNQVKDNGQLGISLGNAPAALPNDLNDADAAALYGNAGQNYPVIQSVLNCGSTTTVSGTVNVDVASGSQKYRLDFYVIPTGSPVDASGHGEGNRYLGSIYQTPSANPFNFSFTPAAALPLGTVISATCSKENAANVYATSEFSDTALVKLPGSVTLDTLATITCFGGNTGSLEIVPTGAAPFSYDWYMDNILMSAETNAVISALPAGNYHCIIQDNAGCTFYSDTVLLTEPAALNKNIVVNHVTCAGDQDGSIQVTLNSGGTPGFSVIFYDGSANVIGTYASVAYGTAVSASSLAPGNYSVVITDANLCRDSSIVTVAPSSNSVTAAFSGPTNICVGSTASFNDLSSASPALVSWSWDFGDGNTGSGTSVNNPYLSAGIYTVQLIANNGLCDDTATATITVNALPVINAGTDFAVCSTSATANLSGSASGAAAVNWTSLAGTTITPASSLNPVYGPFNSIDLANGYGTAVLTGVNGACTVSDTVVINIDQQPAAVLGIDQSECSTVPVSLSVVTGTGNLAWTSTGMGIFSAPSAPSTSYDASGDGGATVTVTLTASSALGACIPVSDHLDLFVLQGPSVNAGADYAVCFSAGNTTVPGASAVSYTALNWTLLSGTGFLSGTSTLTPTYTFGTGDEGNTIKLVLEGQNPPCTAARDTIYITIDAIPQVNAGPDKSVCSGNVTSLSGTVVSAVGQTWTSTGGGSFSDPLALIGSYSAILSSGNDTLILTSSANGTCAAESDELILTVDATPVAHAGMDVSICPATATLLDGSGSLSAAAYNWTVSGTTIATTVTTTVSPSISTDYILTVTNAACTDADTVTITTIALPDPAFSYPASTFCSNEGVQVASPVTAGGMYSVVPGALSVNATSGLLDPSSATGTFDVMYTLSTPCYNADTLSITINAAPVANAGTDQVVCSGSLVILDGTSSTGVLNYAWKEISPGTSAIGTTATVNVTPATSSVYELNVSNGLCTDADTISVTVNPIPDASFTYPATSFCANDGLQPASPVTAGGAWSIPGGGAGVDPSTGELDPALISGTIDIIYSLGTPCPNADTVSITVNGLPLVGLAASPNDHNICTNDTLLFSGTPTGGTYVALAGLNVSTGEFIPVAPGAQVVEYQYTDANGCMASDTFQVQVNALPAVSFSGLASSYCTSDGPVTLAGSPSGGSFFLDGVAVGSSPYGYDPTAPGTDSISYYYADATSGCASSTYQLVTVVAAPAVPVLTTTAPYEFCESDPQVLTVSNPDVNVVWYGDAGLSVNLATGVNCSSSLLAPGTGTAYVVNKTGSGCASAPLLVSYTHHTFTDVRKGGPYTTCAGTPVQILLEVPAGIQAAWFPDAAIADTSVLQPVVTPAQTSTYYVQFSITTLPSCTLNDSVQVVIEPCSLENIANAFSPNGDRVNDVWVIHGATAHPDNKVTIFNRWGDVLAKFEGYNNTTVVWDGRYKNELVAAGTYYYVIEYPQADQHAAGWVQVQY